MNSQWKAVISVSFVFGLGAIFLNKETTELIIPEALEPFCYFY